MTISNDNRAQRAKAALQCYVENKGESSRTAATKSPT